MSNILLGVTGSVAATLTPHLVRALQAAGHTVQVVATKPATYFFNAVDIPARVWTDSDEWPATGWHKGDSVLHIELRKWADLLLIAPLSANTMAKLAHGITDNLLTSVARAWDRNRPMVLAPAMNTHMWTHPATAEHIATLIRWYDRLSIVDPVAKTLACGDTGIGAMADISDVVDALPPPLMAFLSAVEQYLI